MASELKPCDFCDESDQERIGFEQQLGWIHRGYIICLSCLARGPEEDTEAEAIAAWNTRPVPQAGEDKLREADCYLAGTLAELGGQARWAVLEAIRAAQRDALLSASPVPDEAVREAGSDFILSVRPVAADDHDLGWLVIRPDGSTVCSVENEDDALLFAASPNLADALSGLLETLEDEWIEGEEDHEPVGWTSDNEGKNQQPMCRTFGHLRRAKAALARLQTPAAQGEDGR